MPVVLAQAEVDAILNHLKPPYRTMIELAWGTGMRKMEIHRLRIKDIDFDRRAITVRQGKGAKDRITVLPERCIEDLQATIKRTEHFHLLDAEEGFPTVEMPYALAKKFPNEARSLHWKYVFVSHKRSVCPRSGVERRHHLYPTNMEKQLRQAVKQAGVRKKITCHTFRHTFATQLLESGYDIRTVQELSLIHI